MNLKLVLRTYAALRQLTDDESALLETLRSLNDSEREQLVETMAPTKAATKKPRKKREAKSSHAQSLSSAIQRVPKGKVENGNNSNDNFADQCLFVLNSATGETCNAVKDDPVHDLTYSSSHEFVAEAAKAASGD